ncbi:MAG: hypothetical protein G01um10147_1087 [Microgenomates group bacterium Gr01-1014_7]|nr:MAG: hypothetical protein G01um10147_1087 [Microgenomates group bacterium Gr01-1014_7]
MKVNSGNTSKLINKNPTTLVRIDAELHRLLKMKAAAEKTTIRSLIEGALADLLSVEGSKRECLGGGEKYGT